MKNVLVTGGAGYIGSHTSLALIEKGYNVYIIDSNFNSSKKSVEIIKTISRKNNSINGKLYFIKGDIRNISKLDETFKLAQDNGNQIESVIHFAGLKSVADSLLKPLFYWENNVQGTLNLLKVMKKNNCNTFIFSSSATIYGSVDNLKIKEDFEIKPIHPYGRTKAAIESLLKDLFKSNSSLWRIANLRYFNPIGAHESGLLGEDSLVSKSNIFPKISEVAFNRGKELLIFGNDWPTKDGTAIRDYIHVNDLAMGHIKTLEKLQSEGCQIVDLNLGCGRGISVLELVTKFQEINNVEVPYKFVKKRIGDVSSLIADNTKAKEYLKWSPLKSLEDMCCDEWRWRNLNPKGY